MSTDVPVVVPPAPAPVEAAQSKRRVFVSRRTFAGLQPRSRRVPATAEDALALRQAELKRQRKAARRRAALPPVPMAPAAFVVIDAPDGDA